MKNEEGCKPRPLIYLENLTVLFIVELAFRIPVVRNPADATFHILDTDTQDAVHTVAAGFVVHLVTVKRKDLQQEIAIEYHRFLPIFY